MSISAGLSLVRLIKVNWDFPGWPYQPGRFLVGFSTAVWLSALVLVCVAAAVVACGLIPAGMPLRRRLRGSGLLACVCVCVAAPLPWAWYQALWLVGVKHGYEHHTLLYPWLGRSSSAVFVCWASLLLTGRWRPIPTWPDRAGRAIGVGFLALSLFVLTCEAIIYATY